MSDTQDDNPQAKTTHISTQSSTADISLEDIKHLATNTTSKTNVGLRRIGAVAAQTAKGLSPIDISKTLDISYKDVISILDLFKNIKEYLVDIESIRVYEQHIINATKLKILNTLMEPDRIAEASSRDLAYIFDVLNKSSRLAEGLSTENVAIGKVNLAKYKTKV